MRPAKPLPSKDQFLMVDKRTIQRIVSFAGILPGETVLEIGAGTGLLTESSQKRQA